MFGFGYSFTFCPNRDNEYLERIEASHRKRKMDMMRKVKRAERRRQEALEQARKEEQEKQEKIAKERIQAEIEAKKSYILNKYNARHNSACCYPSFTSTLLESLNVKKSILKNTLNTLDKLKTLC